MLTSEDDTIEELSKEVYAYFGSAYFFSECLHRGLCNVFAMLTFRSKSDITGPRLEEKLKRVYSLTLGQVSEKAKPLLPPELQPRLTDVIQKRNYLAHYFWFERSHLMGSREGLEELRAELINLATLFRTLDRDVEAFFRPKLPEYGIDDKMLGAAIEHFEMGNPMDPLPDKRYPKKEETIVRAWNIHRSKEIYTIVFEADDGTLWQLSDVGLGWCAWDKPESHWTIDSKLQQYLPVRLNPRPPFKEPWNYSLVLNGATLIVEKPPGQKLFTYHVKKRAAGG